MDEDLNKDGKVDPWEKLCYWLIAGSIATVLGSQVI